jgi:hypothetical protein
MEDNRPAVAMTVREIIDPEERAERQAWRARADRNAAWLQTHAAEVFRSHRGRHICVAGEELFVADSVEEVLRLARAAHPEDDAFFLQYIPKDRVARIYAYAGGSLR